MRKQDLKELFITELEDMYSSEHQIIQSMPKWIKLASSHDLKEALMNHLKQTENQVSRITEIFSILGIVPVEKTCKAMEGLIKEADDLVTNRTKSSFLDAAIISAAQKIEHYEIASYGTLRSFAKHLDFDDEVIDRLKETLEEEGSADKALTKIADGSIFTSGVNKEAAHQSTKNR